MIVVFNNYEVHSSATCDQCQLFDRQICLSSRVNHSRCCDSFDNPSLVILHPLGTTHAANSKHKYQKRRFEEMKESTFEGVGGLKIFYPLVAA